MNTRCCARFPVEGRGCPYPDKGDSLYYNILMSYTHRNNSIGPGRDICHDLMTSRCHIAHIKQLQYMIQHWYNNPHISCIKLGVLRCVDYSTNAYQYVTLQKGVCTSNLRHDIKISSLFFSLIKFPGITTSLQLFPLTLD